MDSNFTMKLQYHEMYQSKYNLYCAIGAVSYIDQLWEVWSFEHWWFPIEMQDLCRNYWLKSGKQSIYFVLSEKKL